MIHTIIVTLTVETSMTEADMRDELFVRYGTLQYVWNNARGLYGPQGVEITQVEVTT